MKKTSYTRIATLCFAVILFLTSSPIAVTVNAASSSKRLSPSRSEYIRCYPLATKGRLSVYTDSSLSRKKASSWYIDYCDEIRIVEISNNGKAIRCFYPIGGGRYTSQPQWVKRSDFFSFDISRNLTVKKTTSKITTYTRSDGRTPYGYAGKGDEVYIICTRGSYTQIAYPLYDNNWKTGWIKSNDANKYLKDAVTLKTDSISVKKTSTSYSNSRQSFNLGASAASGMRLSYYSNNSRISVNSSGTVTIPAGFSGSFSITLSTSGSSAYKPATRSLYFSINLPSKRADSITMNATAKNLLWSEREQSFSIDARSASGLPLSYYSSQSGVSVENGVVKVKAGFAGDATITIRSAGNVNYYPDERTFRVCVKITQERFVESLKGEIIKEVKSNKKELMTLYDISSECVASKLFLQGLGITIGSASGGFTQIVPSMLSNYDFYLGGFQIFVGFVFTEKAMKEADAVLSYEGKRLTGSTAVDFLKAYREYAATRAFARGVLLPMIEDFATLANKSKAEQISKLVEMVANSAFDGALGGVSEIVSDSKKAQLATKAYEIVIGGGNLSYDTVQSIFNYQDAGRAKQQAYNTVTSIISNVNKLPLS